MCTFKTLTSAASISNRNRFMSGWQSAPRIAAEADNERAEGEGWAKINASVACRLPLVSPNFSKQKIFAKATSGGDTIFRRLISFASHLSKSTNNQLVKSLSKRQLKSLQISVFR